MRPIRAVGAILILMGTTLLAQEQATLLWTMRYDGPPSGVDLPAALALAPDGGIWVTGRSSGVNTGQDILTVGYAPGGAQRRVMRFDAAPPNWDEPADIAIDDEGNIYVVGSSSSAGIVTLKYSSEGTFQWVRTVSGPLLGEGRACALAGDSILFVAGRRVNTDFSTDFIVLAYATDGTERWRTTIRADSTFENDIVALAVAAPDRVALCGYLATERIDDLMPFRDIVTILLNGSGTELWRRQFSEADSADDRPVAMGVDAAGNLLVAGMSSGYHRAHEDYLAISYAPDGTERWWTRYGNPDLTEDFATDAETTPGGGLVITGYGWRDGQEFNFNTVQFDSGGALQWAATWDGAGRDFAHGLTVDGTGNVYVTGGTREGMLGTSSGATVAYDPGGHFRWEAIYGDPGGNSVYGGDLLVDDSGHVFIMAQAPGDSTGWDYLTLKYRQGVVGLDRETPLATGFTLHPAYPNPFNPSTTIAFDLPARKRVTLAVYDVLGQPVATLVEGPRDAGRHAVVWDGRDQRGLPVASGVYLVRLGSGDVAQTQKVVLLR